MRKYKIEVECGNLQIFDVIAALNPLVKVVGHKEFSPATEEEIKLAREKYHAEFPEIEIDDDAGTSEADDGTWVQAWVWLSNEDLGIEDEDDEEEDD